MTTIYVIKIFLVTTLCEVAQLCPTLCDPMDCSLLGSSVHGIFQARVLEWVAISFSRRSSQPRDWTPVSLFIGQTLYCLSHQGSLRSFAICMTTLDHSNHISKKKKLCENNSVTLKLSLPLGSSVQSLSRVWLFATLCTAERQASLSIPNSRSPPKPMSIQSVMLSNHLILCHPLFSCPQSFLASGSFQESQLFTSGG